jgi:hypothetical protein
MCPSPTSIINFFKRIKRKIYSKKIPLNLSKKKLIEHKNEYSMNLNMAPRTNKNGMTSEKASKRRAIIFPDEKLTYKIVIERIVKRFLLYYKDTHIGLDEVKDAFEFKEVKQDIQSLRFELSNQLDGLDEMGTSIIQSMAKLNDTFDEHFDLELIKEFNSKLEQI